MANVLLTPLFGNLDNWPGRLLEAPDGTTVVTKTATAFTLRFPATGGDFPNYRLQLTGTGFAYDGTVPIGGTMSTLRIYNGANQLVLTVTGLNTNPFANDLSQFYASVMGSQTPEGDGPSPDAHGSWSQLLAGNDVITGTAGDDWQGFPGMDSGNDVFNMGAGDDRVHGGMGNDTINGGDGFDEVNFSETTYTPGTSAIRGLHVNMVTGTILDNWGGTDRITGIEKVVGSRFNDVFIGSSAQDRFVGGRGRDSFDGGDNSFTLSGSRTEDRRDIVEYQDDYWNGGTRGIIVDLETAFAGGSITGTIRDGFGNLDTVRDIERVWGTRYNDVFVGSRADNVFAGGEGLDSYRGEAGWDSIRFNRWFTDSNGPAVGVNINLALASGQIINDGWGNRENAIGIEAIEGSSRNDTIIGNASGNEFAMREGADTMTGGGGEDTFAWYGDYDLGGVDRVTDFRTTGAGLRDRLAFYTPDFENMSATLTLVNGTAATTAGVGTFIFNAANDTLFWDADGLGGAAARAVVILTNVASLSADNFDLWT